MMRSSLDRLADTARLHYWLGPWAKGDVPERVSSRPVRELPAGSRLYTPSDRAPHGAVLISPGLHYDGPRDPRLDRVARIFATAGHVVLSPAVPDLMAAMMTPRVIDLVAHAYHVLRAAPEVPSDCVPGVFSVSVGSLAALRLAASDAAISRLVIFGGYADPATLIRSLTESPRDPLNSPAAFSTLLAGIPHPSYGAGDLRDAWRAMLRATWPRPELKVTGSVAHHPIARGFAAELPAGLRELFLIGCGVLPGGWPLCESALASGAFGHLDPRPYFPSIRCPVTIVHGIGDDVIPFSQAGELERGLPVTIDKQVLATGMLAHSSTVPLGGRAANLVHELSTFHRICRAISFGGAA